MTSLAEPLEYMQDGVMGTARCRVCPGNGRLYPTGERCETCGGTGRVEWRPYPVPVHSQTDYDIEWLTRADAEQGARLLAIHDDWLAKQQASS